MADKKKASKAAIVLDLVKFMFDIMQTVSFMMFIEEEAIQIRGFGIMSLIREDLVPEVKTQVNALEDQCDSLETFIDSWGHLAPYVRPTYDNYVQATRDEIDAWRAWVTSKEAEEDKYGIRIVSSPGNATIYIDGTNTHKITPQSFYDLSVGYHRFHLTYFSTIRGFLSVQKTAHISKANVKEYRWILE